MNIFLKHGVHFHRQVHGMHTTLLMILGSKEAHSFLCLNVFDIFLLFFHLPHTLTNYVHIQLVTNNPF